jgi:hypothetical protein
VQYQVSTDQRTREHTLNFEEKTPQGLPVRKQIVLAADQTSGSIPQVKRYAVSDRNGRRIASAEVKQVATLQAGLDPQTGKPVFVQVPTDVQMEWPQQQFRINLRLKNAKVNTPYSPAELREMFTKPVVDGVKPINLAQAQYTPSSFRGQAPDRR